MKTHYFGGGPIEGGADAFRRRLLAIGPNLPRLSGGFGSIVRMT